MDSYKIHRTLYDVTIPSMTAGQTLILDETMSAAVNGTPTSFRTNLPSVPLTSDISGLYAGEIDSIEIIPPIGTSGAPPYAGLDVYLVVDGQNYQHYVDIPADAVALGYPLHARTWGGSHLARLLGEPFWRLALKQLGGHAVNSMPLRNSTIKYAQNFGLIVTSQNGFTAAAGYGLRIIIKGWVYTDQDLAYLTAGWNPSVHYQSEARDITGQDPLAFTFQIGAGEVSRDTWQQMPGGVQQGSIKVSPYSHYAVNATASTATARFVLSNSSTTYGQAGNVQNQFQDLGINGPAGHTALLVRAWGVTTITRPANLGRIGWIINGTEVPEQPQASQAGLVVSDAANDYFFGDTGQYLGDNGTGTGFSGLYRPYPHPDGEPLLLYKDIAAPFIAANGTAIPAGAVAFAEHGVIVEGVS
jgi:hypothetical protein